MLIKASERLAQLLEIKVPEATAQDLIKSGIAAGELEDDTAGAASIDSAKFEKILDGLRKSQEPTEEETLAKSQTIDVRDDLPTKDVKRMFDAHNAEMKAFGDRISKSVVSLAEMLAEVQAGLVSIDRRHAELAKSLGNDKQSGRPAPRAALGRTADAETPGEKTVEKDDYAGLRKSLADAIHGELSKPSNDSSRVELLSSALLGVSTTNDPKGFAARIGITL